MPPNPLNGDTVDVAVGAEAGENTDWSGLTRLANNPDGGEVAEGLFASPVKLILPKSDGEVGAAVLFPSTAGVPRADPKALLPKTAEVSVLGISDPKMFAGGDCAAGFWSGEQIIKSFSKSLLAGVTVGVSADAVVAAGFERSSAGALVVGTMVDAALANENLLKIESLEIMANIL